MINQSLVELEVRESIVEIRFNRPASLNAVNIDLARAFLAAVEAATTMQGARVIVISGQGRDFMAGGDLTCFKDAGEQAPQVARELIDPLHKALTKLSVAPQIVVAKLQGAVVGAGMSFALAADLAIAADNVVFNLAYINIANSPDCGGAWSLTQIVGLRKAMEIALLADNINAAEALRLGLVNRVVTKERLEAELLKLAQKLARSAPQALASTKRLLRESVCREFPQQLRSEEVSFIENSFDKDFHEGVAAFLEKREPIFGEDNTRNN